MRSFSPPPSLSFYRALAADKHGVAEVVRPHLAAAGEALHLALLTLTSDARERSQESLESQAAQARTSLLEAVLALGTARVHIPSIRAYSPAVVMSSEARIHRELARLYQLATQLLWWNLHLLPPRRQAIALAPEDEAQLAIVMQDLARTAKIERLLNYGWLPLMGLLVLLGPLYGAPLFSIVVAALAAVIAIWKLARLQRASLALSAG